METKRNATITATIEGMTLTLAFANGEQLVMRGDALNTDIQAHATMHGLKQKLVDAAAISRNPETGRAATVQDKYDAVKTVYDRLLAGAWNANREGGTANGGLLFRALLRMYQGRKTEQDIREFLEGKSDAEKTALRKNPRVAQIIEDIRAETGKAASINTDSILGELED
jgi:hypothetical protein